MLLTDSPNCPQCGHVLDADRAAEFPLGSEATASETEEPCPKCGEMVRVGMVRCWSCGEFMREEMRNAFADRKRRESAPPPAPRYDEKDDDEADDFLLAGDGGGMADAEDEDFLASFRELYEAAGEMLEDAPDEDDFELRGTDYRDRDQLAGADAYDATADGPETYGLKEVADSRETIEAAPEAPLAPAAIEAAAASAAEQVAHSVATGGDVLLAAAIAEEKEAVTRPKRKRRAKKPAEIAGGILVFCPVGHRIHVQDRHAGRIGKCPQCKNLFFVPKITERAAAAAQTGPAAAAASAGAGAWTTWLTDVKLHLVQPAKIKLKPGSMLAEFETVDIGASPAGLLVATLFKGGGMFGGGEKAKKPAARKALFEHLAADKPPKEAPVPRVVVVGTEEAGQLKIVQPADPREESLFAGVPVFGEGRIAVRLPGTGEQGARLYLSFGLSEFRQFSKMMAETFGVQNYGAELGIPLEDTLTEYKCHYSDAVFSALGDLTWHKADPKFKLKLLGWKCAGCGLIVSEDSRKKEKIGGKAPASVAKATCPKCKKKFGNQPLYGLEALPPTAPAPTAAPAAAAAPPTTVQAT